MSAAAPTPLLALAVPDLTAVLPGLVFGGLAALSVVGAIVAATAPRIVHAAFALLGTFFGVAGLYATLGADFVAMSQVLVYVGGILVLLVFGVLLTGRVRGSLGMEKPEKAGFAIFAGGLLFLGLLLALGSTEWSPRAPGEPAETVPAIGRAFLSPDQYLVPFELASVLLLAALVGAAYLARRKRES